MSDPAEQSIPSLLRQLEQMQIELSLQGDDLKIRAPKGALNAALQAQIAGRKSELLSYLRAPAPAPTTSPPASERGEPFPMTDIQKAYWMGRQEGFPLRCVFRVYVELDCQGLDLERLEAAWNRVIERHEMTRVVALPGFMQRILEPSQCRYQIERRDLTGLGTEQLGRELAAIREQELDSPFVPEQWPTFKIMAAEIDGERTYVFFDIDLMNIDASSLAIIFRDWVQLYEDPSLRLPPPGYSYRSYAIWLSSPAHQGSDAYQQALQYWREKAATLPPAPQLPVQQLPAAITQVRFDRREFILDAPAWSRLKEGARESNLTPSSVVLGAFCEVLSTWSGSDRFTLNITLVNRLPVHPEVKEVVGDFTSMVFLDVDLHGAITVAQRFAKIQKQLFSDLEHQVVNGIRVLQEVNRGGLRDGPAFPVVFSGWINDRMGGFPMLQRLGKQAFFLSNTPQLTLDNQVYEDGGKLFVAWDFVEGVYPDGLLDQMMAAFHSLLERLAAEPSLWHREPPSLTPAAQLALYAKVSDTSAPISPKRLHDLFLDRVEERAAHPGVISASRSLSYGDLEQQSARLARVLRHAGARPNQLVAVVMEKGWEQIVASLSILRSGAAYLPIDPGLPPDRIRYMFEHGEARLALTQACVEPRIRWPEGVQRFQVEGAPERSPAGEIDRAQTIEDLAYVLYTSGSTGTPKGVMIEHRNAVNTILDVSERYGINSSDRSIFISSLSFDLSVYDLWGTLGVGGSIVVPDALKLRDPAYLQDLVVSEKITVWNSVPALVEMLVEHCLRSGARLPSLRRVLMSGDWIPVSLPEKIRAVAPEAEVISLGGPTETSIWSVTYPVRRVDPSWTSIPYGRPLRNQTVEVLNERLSLCPIGVPGELYIGGAGVGRGYWRDEERTNASFIRHPGSGRRLYKSGDRGRYLPDGDIEILGRTDFQVKIRGYRIEPGEVESVLKQDPDVRSVVVAVRGDTSADRRLVAYVVPASSPGSNLPATSDGAKADFKLARKGIRRDLTGEAITLSSSLATHRHVERRTIRRFDTHPVEIGRLGQLLECLRGVEIPGAPLPKFRYPSAGSTYGVQVYLFAKKDRINGLAEGVYYYHPIEHRLRCVSPEAMDRFAHIEINQELFEDSAFTLLLIGQSEAVKPLYGPLSDDFLLLEAGYMSQLLMTEGGRLGIGLCPVGGVDFDRLRPLLALDAGHRFLHGILGGALEKDALTLAGMLRELSATPLRSNGAPRQDLPRRLVALARAKLPEYMVPSAVVLLDALPLSLNGKVDLRQLPDPGKATSEPQPEGGALPKNDLERKVADVVSAVLGRDRIGTRDNFFDLGATSMQLVQIQERLRETLSSNLCVVDLFENPSISALSQALSSEPKSDQVVEQGDAQGARRKSRAEGRHRRPRKTED